LAPGNAPQRAGSGRPVPAGAPRLDERHQDLIHDLGEQLIEAVSAASGDTPAGMPVRPVPAARPD